MAKSATYCPFPWTTSNLSRPSFSDIISAVTRRQEVHENAAHKDTTWQKYRVLLRKLGTGKSQVLIGGIHYAIENEMSVLVAAPVALLAQGCNKIFLQDVTTDPLHGAFNIPVDSPGTHDINYAINKFDLVVVDEASMISSSTFSVMASIFNRLKLRRMVVYAGNKPLTVESVPLSPQSMMPPLMIITPGDTTCNSSLES